jgi:hypothetical protein
VAGLGNGDCQIARGVGQQTHDDELAGANAKAANACASKARRSAARSRAVAASPSEDEFGDERVRSGTLSKFPCGAVMSREIAKHLS